MTSAFCNTQHTLAPAVMTLDGVTLHYTLGREEMDMRGTMWVCLANRSCWILVDCWNSHLEGYSLLIWANALDVQCLVLRLDMCTCAFVLIVLVFAHKIPG